MTIFLTGDTHGSHEMHKLGSKVFPEGLSLTKDDYVIVCGDFGGVWSVDPDKPEELYWLKWLDDKPFTTLFVDGNHENHERLAKLPRVEMFGGDVGKVNDSVFHLRRGQVYNIDGVHAFCMGGASSTDREYRQEGVSWWAEERPSDEEYRQALANLEAVGNKVDIVLTHTAPSSVIARLGAHPCAFAPDGLTEFLQYLADTIDFKYWFFGHFHLDKRLDFDDRFRCLYADIISLV